jgi:4-amino-4-deoxy-L-arabinose transferase-like glycosyltransferase
LSVIIPSMAKSRSKATTPTTGLAVIIEKHERLVVVGLVALGLLVRLAHFFQIEANDPYFYFPSVDPGVYHEWAARIAGGEWLGDDVFFLAPLYPYALGVLYKITGASLYAARLFQLVIGAGSCALIYLLGKRTLGAATGALAALTWSIYSMSVFYDGVLLVAAIQTPLNLLLALALVRASSRPGGVLNWALAGALLGISALARPNVLLLVIPILPWMYFSFRRRLSKSRLVIAAMVFGASTTAVILPVTIRNLVVGDDIVLISAQGGANFYIGNGPGATGVFRVPSVFPPTRADDPMQQRLAYTRVARSDLGEDLAPSEISRYWWNRASSHIADHPDQWIHLMGLKLGLFFNEFESGNSRDYPSSRNFSSVLRLPLPTFGLVAPLALLGMALAWKKKEALVFPLYAMVLTYVVSLMIFFVLSHYRMPVMPFMVLFAAYGVVWIAEKIRERRMLPLVLAAGTLALCIVVTQMDLVDDTGSRFMVHYNLGNKFRQMENIDRAAEEYERSIDLNPHYISSHHNLALMTERMPERRARAVAAWERVLELGGENKDAMYVERARQHLRYLSSLGR